MIKTTAVESRGIPAYVVKRWSFRIITYAFLVIISLLFLVPVYGAFATAFRPNEEIIREGFWALPSPPQLVNFKTVWEQGTIRYFLANTVVVTAFATIISIAMGTLAGYAFGKLRFKFDTAVFIVVIAGMYIPPHVVLIPVYNFVDAAGLLDTLAALVIVHVGFGIPICSLVMGNFFRTLPDELRDVARIDGCHDWRIMSQIMLPLARPALTALAILQFTWIWNDFVWPLVLIQTEQKMTIQLGVLQLRGQYGLAWGTQAAAYLIATLPTLLVFLFMQRHFVRGMTFGALKE